MPSKKKKYNARFPPARIKKIMQSDEEVGKVAQAVPVIISRALELFVESLLKKAEGVTHARNAKTLTPSHLKQCIMAEQRFDFLKDVVSSIPDVQGDEDVAETPTPRSAVSNSSFVFPPSSTATSSSSSTTPHHMPTASASTSQAPTDVSTPTPPSYAASLPEQKYGTQNMHLSGSGGGVHHSHPMSARPPAFPSHSVQSTINPTVPVIVPNPSVIHQHLQQNSHSSILNPVGVNSSPYIPTSGTSHPGQYTMYHQQQHNNPNGVGGYGMNEPVLSYGIRGADGSLASANSAMMNTMYDQKNSPISYQYHQHQSHHSNHYHSQ